MTQKYALQLCPFSDYLELKLNELLNVVRWFELSSDEQTHWLAENAHSVGAIATGGHIGCTNQLMEQLPNLGVIAINGVGFDKVDLKYAQTRKVAVTTTPNALTDDVADLAVGLIISLLRQIPKAHTFVQANQWPNGELGLGRKVTGRKFGIVGLGNIGSAIAARLSAFGPIAYTSTQVKDVPYTFFADANALAEHSDVLIVASAANASTRGLINSSVLKALGPQGYLVNIARGSVVDEQALIDAVNNNALAGIALDVFADEPNVPQALRSATQSVLTPHIASATQETRQRMADIVLENLSAYLQNAPLPHRLV